MKDDILEIVVFFASFASMALLTWLYLLSTPEQLSAEADAHKAACDNAGMEYMPCKGGEK